MSLLESRLSEKIEATMEARSLETEDPAASRKSFADELAKAIVEEIKMITIIATAPSGGGPVTITKIE